MLLSLSDNVFKESAASKKEVVTNKWDIETNTVYDKSEDLIKHNKQEKMRTKPPKITKEVKAKILEF